MAEKDGEEPIVVVEHEIRMKKSLTLLHCVAILCAVTGHISVFVAPTAILQYTGSVGLSLLFWLMGGALNLLLALNFVELALMFPKAGGPYAFVLHVFGGFAGFMIMWGYLMMITGPFWALMSYSAALYILQPFYDNCRPPEAGVKLFAAWFLVTFVAVNSVYVKLITKVQTILSITKLLALLLIIVCGIIRFVKGSTPVQEATKYGWKDGVYLIVGDGRDTYDDIWEGSTTEPSKISIAALFSIFTYGGWQILMNLIEETKEPQRDLPRAVYLSFFIITLKLVLVNMAYYVVLTPTEILNSETVALLFFQRSYPLLKAVISVLVAVTCIGVLNASILGHSRVLFAASRNGHAPVIFSMISTKFYTPWPAVFALSVCSLVVLFSGGLMMIIELISLFSIMMSGSVVFTVLYLRYTQPHAHRPYRTQIWNPVTSITVCVITLCMSIYQEPYKLGRGLAILACGVPVYILGVMWKRKPKLFISALNSLTIKAQKVLIVRKST